MTDEKNGNSSLDEVLRAQIIELASKGDPKNAGKLTPEVLAKIVRVAKTGRDLLVSLNASPATLAAMGKRRHGFGIVGEDSMDDLGDGEMSGPMPYAISSPSENFGMTALREFIAVAKNHLNGGNSPSKLVEALAIAREMGLTDVAVELETQLGMKKPVVEVKPVESKETKP